MKAGLLIVGVIFMALGGVIQIDVLSDLYIVPKEEMGPLLASGAFATAGFIAILFATEEREPDND